MTEEWQRCVTNHLITLIWLYKRCLFCARVSTYSAEESSESILLGGGGPFCLGGPLPSGGPGPPLEPPLPPSLPPLGPSFFDPFLPFLGRSSSESSLGSQKFEKFKLLIYGTTLQHQVKHYNGLEEECFVGAMIDFVKER